MSSTPSSSKGLRQLAMAAAPEIQLIPPSLKVHPPTLAIPNTAAASGPPDSTFVRQIANFDHDHHRPPHATRRVFIGAMPEKVVAHFEAGVRKKGKAGDNAGGVFTLGELEADAPEESEDLTRMVKGHARKFVDFYRSEGREKRRREKEARKASQGTQEEEMERVESGISSTSGGRRRTTGKKLLNVLSSPVSSRFKNRASEESSELGHTTTNETDNCASSDDWDEDYEEQNLADELIQRWKDSDWGKAWRHRRGRKKKAEMFQTTGHWLGGSFEVGTVLGVNLLNPPPRQARPTSVKHPSSSLLGGNIVSGVFGTGSGGSGSGSGNHLQDSNSQANLLTVPGDPPDLSSDIKGKQRAVRYASPPPEADNESVNPPPPVPPEEVLARSETGLDPTSSSAAMFSSSLPSPALPCGDVVMRDRMLVRVVYSKLESLSPKFDDSIHRTTRDLQFEDCAEFMVVWRKDLIELYEDHTVPGKEMVTGHKHLAYVIPLKSNRTNLSLYSFVDLTFCLTCPPTSTRLAPGGGRGIFNRAREGTNIFLFQHKNRSRAWDWTWQLWRCLGGTLPPSIEVHNPRLNSTVTIDIPYRLQVHINELYAMFTRDNIIQLCMQSLSSVPDWFALVEQEITQHGKRLDLCWRRDAHLDWLWLDEDIYGNERPWATLAGLAVQKSSRPASLEIRLTSHAPSYYHLRNDPSTKIAEPPSVEGYVDRIRPNTQTKQPLYLSTHNGLLFMNHVQDAFPPLPPGLALTMQDLDSWIESLHKSEVIRGANQVMHASGVCDLRTVVLVRRASSPVPHAMHQEKGPSVANDESGWYEHWSAEEVSTLDDDEDEGGEGYLAQRADRSLVRMRRCFELLLNTGHVVRFECHSRKFAVEWVNRLRALILFWQCKKRTMAQEEIELAQARRPRLTPQIRVCPKEECPPEPPADMSAPYAAMDNLYHWCIIDGCNPITKVTKLHMRKGLRGQYKPVYLALVQGHLVRFRIKPGSAFHMSGAKKINLLDAYVFSGYFAAMNLPSGQFSANAPSAPRRYLDGLETDDREEDMLFMIWYHSHPWATDAAKAPTVAPAPSKSKSFPNLGRKANMLVFKTRSRIERDAWCWALTTEIEKIARVQREREEKLRDMGNVIEMK